MFHKLNGKPKREHKLRVFLKLKLQVLHRLNGKPKREHKLQVFHKLKLQVLHRLNGKPKRERKLKGKFNSQDKPKQERNLRVHRTRSHRSQKMMTTWKCPILCSILLVSPSSNGNLAATGKCTMVFSGFNMERLRFRVGSSHHSDALNRLVRQTGFGSVLISTLRIRSQLSQ